MRGLSVLVGGKTVEKEQMQSSLLKRIALLQLPTVPSLIAVSTARGADNRSYCRMIGLALRSGNPDARKIDVRSIATVCLNCKHIGNYSMFRSCRGFDTRHKVMHSPNNGQTVLLHWLQCVERTCPDRVPLFARLESDSPAGEAEAAGWLWDELTCPSGHSIVRFGWIPRYPLPLRTPAGAAEGQLTTRNQLSRDKARAFRFRVDSRL